MLRFAQTLAQVSKNLEFLCVPGTETRPERDVAGTSAFAAPVRQWDRSFYALQTEARFTDTANARDSELFSGSTI